MANLDRETIHYLTSLCRIHCTEEEEDQLLHDLKRIFDFFEQLKEVDTEGVPPCNHVLPSIVNALRDDLATNTLSREAFLANAPSHIGGMVRVPPVLKSTS